MDQDPGKGFVAAKGLKGETSKQTEARLAIEKRKRESKRNGDEEAADQARYELNQLKRQRNGLPPLTREEWQPLKEGAHESKRRGKQREDSVLDSVGVENNNYSKDRAGEKRKVVTYTDKDGVTTRPDGISDTHWIDVKSFKDGSQGAVARNTAQIIAERRGAQAQGKEHAIIIDSDDLSVARPSKKISGSTVFHHDKKTGTWSIWDSEAKNKKGGWVTVDHEDVKSSLGGSD